MRSTSNLRPSFKAAVLGLFLAAVTAGARANSDSIVVSLKVQYFLSISFASASDLTIGVLDGGLAKTYNSQAATFSIKTNDAANVVSTVTQAGPGNWTSLLSADQVSYVSGQAGFFVNQGSALGYVKVQVTGLGAAPKAGNYSNTLMVTVSQN